MIKMHCDGPLCDKITDPEQPAIGWIKSESISSIRTWQQEESVRYYCSTLCEHNHTYILSHADAGK